MGGGNSKNQEPVTPTKSTGKRKRKSPRSAKQPVKKRQKLNEDKDLEIASQTTEENVNSFNNETNIIEEAAEERVEEISIETIKQQENEFVNSLPVPVRLYPILDVPNDDYQTIKQKVVTQCLKHEEILSSVVQTTHLILDEINKINSKQIENSNNLHIQELKDLQKENEQENQEKENQQKEDVMATEPTLFSSENPFAQLNDAPGVIISENTEKIEEIQIKIEEKIQTDPRIEENNSGVPGELSENKENQENQENQMQIDEKHEQSNEQPEDIEKEAIAKPPAVQIEVSAQNPPQKIYFYQNPPASAGGNEGEEQAFFKGVKWSPDGTCLLVNCEDKRLRLFEL